MKGDFTRDTFKPENHYRQVLMQQGRVQLDADWNEQAAIGGRRDETTTADLAGDCGGSANSAAFAIITTPALLSTIEASPTAPIRQFALSAGRYYVDGIQCEVESPFLFSWQPDYRENAQLAAGRHLLYLDVWQRHLTVIDDRRIREAALGGPDTGTRVKTVWQVRAKNTTASQCADAAGELAGLQRAHLPKLKARTGAVQPEADPCALPATAGYRGMENQLYRVEIHEGGGVDAATFKWSRENGSVVTAITDFTVDATGTVLTVAGTGPDEVLGFKNGDIVELVDDHYELNGLPGKLAVIDGNPGDSKIKLRPHASQPLPIPAEIDLKQHAKLRRWEGLMLVTRPTSNNGYLDLESEVEIRFDTDGDGYRSGDYWMIPARTATAEAISGDIEWPRDLDPSGRPDNNQPHAVEPKGITHHYCRLGIITVLPDGTVDTNSLKDCRCLWPALTAVPRLFYVSGDGQEVMPDLTNLAQTHVPLANPLIVGMANPQCLDSAHSPRVRFTVSGGRGKVSDSGGVLQDQVDVSIGLDGCARCQFHLEATPPPADPPLAPTTPADTAGRPIQPNQQVTAHLLDDAGREINPPIHFNANLSVASQVAYQPGGCAGLAGQKTVQDAIARLASMISLHKVSGDGQQAVAGTALQPLVVLAANRCGPTAGMRVVFRVVSGGGTVTPNSSTTDSFGLISCGWQLGNQVGPQEVEAELLPDANRPVTEPRRVRFVAQVAGSSQTDPAPVRVVGMRFGKPSRVLANGQTLTPRDLEGGLIVLCDQPVNRDTVLDPTDSTADFFVRGQPTCFVTIEVPYPLTQAERSMWDMGGIAGYRPMVLLAQVAAADIKDSQVPGAPLPDGLRARGAITWQGIGPAFTFISRLLGFLGNIRPRPDKVLARLTLKGNFIWSDAALELFKKGTPGGFLDGESLRAPTGFGQSELMLPSGDQQRGGDFEMWFWLAANTPPVITRAPQDVTVNVGQNATFNVEFTSTGAVSFQWQKNGVAIPGATNASFTVANAQLADDGSKYRVVLISETGSATTPEATLRVLPNIKLTDKVADKVAEKAKDTKEIKEVEVKVAEVKPADKPLEGQADPHGAAPARGKPAPGQRGKPKKPSGSAFIRPEERPATSPRPGKPPR